MEVLLRDVFTVFFSIVFFMLLWYFLRQSLGYSGDIDGEEALQRKLFNAFTSNVDVHSIKVSLPS